MCVSMLGVCVLGVCVCVCVCVCVNCVSVSVCVCVCVRLVGWLVECVSVPVAQW